MKAIKDDIGQVDLEGLQPSSSFVETLRSPLNIDKGERGKCFNNCDEGCSFHFQQLPS